MNVRTVPTIIALKVIMLHVQTRMDLFYVTV